jgi:indole-3-glycerol phosphate synthase
MSSDILARILATKTEEVAALKRATPLAEVRAAALDRPPPRGFRAALAAKIAQHRPGVIAEIKKASPSAGVLREPFDVSAIAASYAAAGASCLSVLTDATYFQGAADCLGRARDACDLPALRKDFVIEPWQVYESRLLGADCILLIVAALTDKALAECAALAGELAMDVLFEVHDAAELERAVKLKPPLIGINNRDLTTFKTDLETTLQLARHIPPDCTIVSESGIRAPEDVALLRAHGIHGFLVGEAFMRASDPGEKLFELFF